VGSSESIIPYYNTIHANWAHWLRVHSGYETEPPVRYDTCIPVEFFIIIILLLP